MDATAALEVAFYAILMLSCMMFAGAVALLIDRHKHGGHDCDKHVDRCREDERGCERCWLLTERQVDQAGCLSDKPKANEKVGKEPARPIGADADVTEKRGDQEHGDDLRERRYCVEAHAPDCRPAYG